MKQKLVPIISIIIGILAFLLTKQFIQSKQQEYTDLIKAYKERTREVQIVAAGKDLPQGTRLRPTDLALTKIAQINMPERAITREDGKIVLGRKTLYNIKANQMILWSDIEGGDPASQGLAPMVKDKLRAISLNISGAASVSGMVKPNDRVDILGTFSFPSKQMPGQMETVTLTVLQDVEILATGQKTAQDIADARGRSSSGYSTVTVQATPREAELLVFAQQMRGSLTLSLRNPSDNSYESSLPSVNFEQLERSLPELNRFRQQYIHHKKVTH